MSNSVTLFLATYKGLCVLDMIVRSNLSSLIKGVVIGKDKNIVSDFSTELVSICKLNEISWCFIDDFDYDNIGEFSLAISWNRILNTDKTKLIVIHDSLLPKYRGFAPLVNQLLNCEKVIGVTAFNAADDYDKGDIIFQEEIPINYPIKIKEAIKVISRYYESICFKILKVIETGEKFITFHQIEEQATYSLWRDYEDYFINWANDSTYISRFIDSVGEPFLGAQTYMDGEKITILESKIIDDLVIENRTIGKVIFNKDNFPVIVCGKGLLMVTKAVYSSTGESIFPLKRFRIRFK
jgi:methionyl-tRNA formyltransferase